MTDNIPLPNIEELKMRVRAGFVAVYADTERNVLSGLVSAPELSEELRADMHLLHLAFYNSITGEILTWAEADKKTVFNKKALDEAKKMLDKFCKGVIREQMKFTAGKFVGRFRP